MPERSQSPTARQVAIRTLILYVATICFVGSEQYVNSLGPARALARSHVELEATFVGYRGHAAAGYMFQWGGTQHEGSGQFASHDEVFSKHPGDTFPVYVVPEKPQISSLVTPEANLKRAESDTFAAVLVFPLLAIPILAFGAYQMAKTQMRVKPFEHRGF